MLKGSLIFDQYTYIKHLNSLITGTPTFVLEKLEAYQLVHTCFNLGLL
jgi:G:T-mismatch repair DNA endonuclease (very short patch repair protein)